MNEDKKSQELISEKDYNRFLKEFNSLRAEADRKQLITKKAWAEYDAEVQELLYLREILNKKIKERLEMPSKEVFVLSKTMKKDKTD